MTIAAKHLDPLVGLDTHIILIPTPAGPVPTPLPNPYVGMVMDPMDYVPVFGATTFINGLPRGQAGSSGLAVVPHLPLGGPFMKPPSNESEIFMGSATVLVDGEPQSFLGLMVLSCQDIGMPAPPRAKKKTVAKSLMLPTTVVLSIPMGMLVLIGGPPTISMMAMGMHLALGALKKLKKLKAVQRRVKAMSDRLHNLAAKLFDKLGLGDALRNRAHRAICTVTGHPVDVATGKLFADAIDFGTPGPLPFSWERVWYSTSSYRGPLGHGWHHAYDLSLRLEPELILLRTADGRHVPLPHLREGQSYFDERERITLIRDRFGFAVQNVQGAWHRFAERGVPHVLSLVEISDRVQQRLRFEYEDGRLVRVWDCTGRCVELTFDDRGLLRAMSAPHPTHPGARLVVVRYDYDRDDNLVASTNALGHRTTYAYEGHLLVRETNRVGLSFHFSYDGRGPAARCVRTWGDGGLYDHKLVYREGVTLVENSLGNCTTYFHDGALVHKTRDALGNERKTERDDKGRVVAETDELGQRTTWNYDDRGNLCQVTGPDGGKLSLEYDALDLPVAATDPIGSKWKWSRDDHGRLLEAKDPLGRSTKYEYHGPWLSAVQSPAGGRTGFGYDAAGNIETVHGPDGAVTSFAHDALGRVVSRTDARGNREDREYDLVGHVTRVRYPDGNTAELAYDGEGNVVDARDANHEVKLAYCGLGRLAARTEGGTTIRFEYDTEERLIAVYDAHGSAHRVERGPTGQIDREIGFDGLTRRFTRDARGQVTRMDRPAQRFTEYGYDAAGRVVAIRYFDGTSERFGYRLDGEPVLAENDASVVKLERDPVGRVVRETQGPHWVESEYDVLGMRTRLRSSFDIEHTIERSITGLPLQLEEKQSRFRVSSLRDVGGLELERELPGGLSSRWQRDRLGRPIEHQVARASGAALRSVGYVWEPNGRLSRAVDADLGPAVFEHDALGRLSGARRAATVEELRVPDAVGNLFRTRERNDRRYGPAGQLLEAHGPRGVTQYAYDEEGNLIQRTEPDGRRFHFEWNAAGLMRKVIRPDGSAVEFVYDALGRRIQKKFRGQTTNWVWDGNVPLHEWVEGDLAPLETGGGIGVFSTDAAITKREAELEQYLARGPPERGSLASPITWLFEPECFAPVAKLTAAGSFSIVTDHADTPVLVMDSAGKVIYRARTTIWGEVEVSEGDRFACPFRFPGQYEDVETGLYYNRFRYYDPDSGEYLSQDPIGLAGGLGMYAYVGDPSTQSDPFGLSCGPTQPKNTWNQFQQATRGTYASRADAAAGYRKLKGGGTSPWPDGVTPKSRTMAPGETFNMALGPGQPPTRPGGFGTPDAIPNQQFVADNLAVKQDWKPTGVDRSVTYRVKKPLPVQQGPVGPQFDHARGRVLPGGADQVEMMVPPADRMDYLDVVSVDPLPP